MSTQKLVLRHGDSFEVIATLEEGSLGACVCDPPYGLSFMGKAFDNLGTGKAQREWHKQWLTPLFRALRPGGVVKAFCGTRTMHHLAGAIEEVGFENIGLSSWIYGCLSSDAEILTESGWKLGTEVQVGEKVACWDAESNAIQLDVVEDKFLAPFKGDLISFKNDNTDQLLTPNHRVYKKHRVRTMSAGERVSSEEPNWNVQTAGSINRWNNIRLPLAGFHSGPGIGGVELAEFLGWIWSEGGFDIHGTGVRITQSSVNQEHVDAIQKIVVKLAPAHKKYTRERQHQSRNAERGLYTYTEHTWFFTGEIALKVREMLPNKHPTWDLIWNMTQEEKKAFMWAAIRGDGALKQGKTLKNGSQGVENYVFYQKSIEDLHFFQALCHLTGQQGRINTNKYVCGIHNNPTTQLQSRHLHASTHEPYDGLVWCVKVPSGAFIARRKNLVFITGNSGFPKSANTAKAIDRMLGAERETKRVEFSGNALMRHGGDNTRPWMENAVANGYHELPGDKPASPEAMLWDGWGTALKPAWEPVILGSKPL